MPEHVVEVTDGWSEASGQELVDFLDEIKQAAFEAAREHNATATTVFHVVGTMIDAKLDKVRDEKA